MAAPRELTTDRIVHTIVRATRGAMLLALFALGSATLGGCADEESNEIVASGTVEADEVTVSPLVTGPVLRLAVEEGDEVRRGDTLAVIDDTDLRLQRAQLLAGVDISRAQYELLANGPRPEDLGQAEEGVRQARATLDNAADDLRRMKELYETGAVPQKSVDDAATRHEIAARAHESARLALTRLRKGSRQEELRAGVARESQAVALVQALDKRIRDCVILAPYDGVVSTITIDAGELAPAGGALMTLARTGPLELSVYLTEAEIGRVKVGQTATVAPETSPERKADARITFISPTAEFTPKNIQTKDDRTKQVFEVRLTVPDAGGALKPGMTADARIPLPRTNVAEGR